MTRLSNSTLRAVRILDYLVANPDEGAGLSALARALGINKSTCLSILRSLTLTGYVAEDPEAKVYSLGPALLAAQTVGGVRWAGLDHARTASRRLSEQLGVCADVHVRAGGHITVVDRNGPLLGPLQPVVRVGLRKPFVAPLGIGFVSWATPAQYQSWLQPWTGDAPGAGKERNGPRDRTGAGAVGHPVLHPDALARFTAQIERCIEACRSRGYSIELETPGLKEFQKEAVAQVDHPDYDAFARRALEIVCSPDMVDYAQADLQPSRRYPVSSITSPIVAADGSSSVALSLVGFESKLGGGEVHELGDVLATETRRISRELGAALPGNGRP